MAKKSQIVEVIEEVNMPLLDIFSKILDRVEAVEEWILNHDEDILEASQRVNRLREQRRDNQERERDAEEFVDLLQKLVKL